MGHRRKRQKLAEDGTEASLHVGEDEPLSHSKTQRRSLFIRSLAPNTTTEDLTGHFSQSYPIKHAIAVIDPATKLCKGYGFVTFADAEDAERALKEFNGTTFHGKQLRLEVAEPRHREDEGHGAKASVVKPKGVPDAPHPSSKLIARNLPWSIDTPEKLSLLFRSYGKIKHAVVPKNAAGRMSGFGIIVLRGRKNAEKALDGVNGKQVDGRTIAVDWAVDRDTWQEVQKTEVQNNQTPGNTKIAPGAASPEDTGKDSEENIEPGSDFEETDEEAEDPDNMDENEEGSENNAGHKLPEPSDKLSNQATIFVRNLPFTCTDDELFEHFNQFGSVRYARIVLDHSTDRSKGTGFVCFSKAADAERCIREAPKTTTPKTSAKATGGKGESRTKSVLQDELLDPSGNYTLDGRVLQVSKAVGKTEADRLAKEDAARRNTRDKDKRRLYLLSEGTISSNSPLYKQLSASEIAMREASAKQRKMLIESNPSLHISLCRLAVRNIPRSISSKDLKALAREAVVNFAKDVKASLRQPLSKEELSRAREEMQLAENERKHKGKGIVKQAKVVFEGRKGEKVDESSGAGRSRGYGFIEYYTHRSALMGLRWLNGRAIDYKAAKNSTTGKVDKTERKKRLIVEFALENAKVVHRRKERESRARKNGDLRDENIGNATESLRDDSERVLLEGHTKRGRKGADRSVDDRDHAATQENSAEAAKVAKRSKIVAKRRAKQRHRKQLSSRG